MYIYIENLVGRCLETPSHPNFSLEATRDTGSGTARSTIVAASLGRAKIWSKSPVMCNLKWIDVQISNMKAEGLLQQLFDPGRRQLRWTPIKKTYHNYKQLPTNTRSTANAFSEKWFAALQPHNCQCDACWKLVSCPWRFLVQIFFFRSMNSKWYSWQ